MKGGWGKASTGLLGYGNLSIQTMELKSVYPKSDIF